VMNRDLNTKGCGDFFFGKLEEPEPAGLDRCGLAGTWTMDDNAGGLCHY
jgi:indoleamine 2,3-dioxygenase